MVQSTPAVQFPPLPPKSPQGQDLLAEERARATFDVKSLSYFLYTKEYLERVDKILAIIEAEPTFDKRIRMFNGRTERIVHALRKDKRMIELTKEHNWDIVDRSIAQRLYSQSTPFSLHNGMFIPTLEGQANEEQRKLFLEPAKEYKIIGCYAQTELGHGSNVQGLETTATYIPETNEFEIHSPTLTSSKWWIGGLGKAANYAIVMARLIMHGKDFGPHPFCVQIRSLEDHRPLPGITVGDIGPKMGYTTTDNGFIMFDHYRVPHIAFLAKYSKVIPGTGEYVKPPNNKISYGTMVFVRASLVMGAQIAMAKAAVVGVRYSAVRRQFVDAANPRQWGNEVIETPVIDYTTQQYRVFPVVAGAYACLFTAREMMRLYNLNQEAMKKGNFSLLADTHASSSGLKSLTTTMAVDGIETCRRACGGHGYSLFSGLSQLYMDYLPNATFEGDNYILTQQTGRYLLKTFREAAAGKAKQSEYNYTLTYLTSYFASPKAICPATAVDELLNPETIIAAFGYRAARGIARVAEQLDQQGKSWNAQLINIAQISKAHCQYILVRNFFTAIQKSNGALDTSIQQALLTLAQLFALHTMDTDLSDFVISGYLSPAQAEMVKEAVVALLEKVRPNAVAFVDAFALPDYFIDSALGRYDGNVYEAMTKLAEQEPLNATEVIEGYEECIRPLVHAGLNKAQTPTLSKL